jgi:hypothetical protein
MSRPATFTVTLRTHGDRAHRRLARTLKTALRRDQLEAIDIREHRASRRRPAQAAGASQARRGDTTMDMRKYSGKAFLNADDVRAGPLRVVIVDVREGKFDKPDLEFDDGTRLGVSATNNRTLIASYGTESDDWINKEIELSLGELKYEGEMQEAVIVKPISPPIEKKPPPPKPKNSRGGDMDDDIPY